MADWRDNMVGRINVVDDVVLGLPDAVCQPVVLIPPLVAEELSVHRDAAEVTIVLITSILAVVPRSWELFTRLSLIVTENKLI